VICDFSNHSRTTRIEDTEVLYSTIVSEDEDEDDEVETKQQSKECRGQYLVLARGGEESTVCVPGDGGDDALVNLGQSELLTASSLSIPELYFVVRTRSNQEVAVVGQG